MIPAQPTAFQSASLYVGELHFDITESTLFELFNRVGPVASIRVCRDTLSKRSLGYAYVNFHNVQDAERALDTMNYTEIRGRPCRIMWSQRDPSVRKSGLGNIFIKNLPPSLDHKSLFDIFSVFGNILSCKVATDENGGSKGYGYIHYETAEAAQEAIKKFHGNSIDEYTVEVLPFVRRGERSTQTLWTNTYIKQFPKSWNEAKVKELVTPYGEVANVVIMKDADGQSKGFGFVNFVSHEGASAAVDAVNKIVVEDAGQSFSLYMSRAQKKNERQRELQSLYNQKREEKLNLYQGRNLYIKNIDDEISDEELMKIFSEHGVVANAKIMRDANGASKGFGFVCFNNADDAQKSITALNGTRIRSKPLVVTLHQRKDVRRAQLQSGDRWRFMNGPGMGPVPMMMMPNGQGQFPNPRQYYGEFPRGNNGSPRGMPQPVRPPYFPMNGPYPVQPGAPIGGQPQQMKRMANGPAGQMPVAGRGAPAPGGNPAGRGVPGQNRVMSQPRPQGMPVGAFPNRNQGVKFTNQVRNPTMPLPNQMVPQPVDMGANVGMLPMGMELDHKQLAAAEPHVQKNMIGERLYPLVLRQEPQRAGKITGMLLEMDITELLNLLESPEALINKIREAVMVLEQHERGVTSTEPINQ